MPGVNSSIAPLVKESNRGDLQFRPQLLGDPIGSGAALSHQVEHEVSIRAGAGDAIGQGCFHGSAKTVKTVAQGTVLVYADKAVVPNAAPVHPVDRVWKPKAPPENRGFFMRKTRVSLRETPCLTSPHPRPPRR